MPATTKTIEEKCPECGRRTKGQLYRLAGSLRFACGHLFRLLELDELTEKEIDMYRA